MTKPNPNPVDGPVEILICTYWKDFPWLNYALQCIQKYCRGFAGVTVITPNPVMVDGEQRWIPPEWFDRMSNLGPVRIRAVYYDEPPGKGMLSHMVVMAEAEQRVPEGTKYVLTCDADCMFHTPTKPEDYFWENKPYYIIRTWASLTTDDPHNPGSKTVSDCLQWKGPTDAQLGFDTDIFGMCMNTVVFPIEFFPKYREHIEKVHRRPFASVILSGRNEFPQTSMDFTAMGAYAHRFMHDRFHWFDVEKPPYPMDRKRAYWSHGGILPEIRTEIEGFLKSEIH